MTQDEEQQMRFESLHDISLRKAQLLKAIHKDNKEIGRQWNDLFRKDETKKGKGYSFANIVGNSIGVLDGALFAWKLYRKFKK